jgi:serine protease Do
MRRKFFGLSVGTWLAGVALLALVGMLAARTIAKDPTVTSSESTAAVSSQEAKDYAKSLSKAFREAAEKVLPAVVTIEVKPEVAERPSRPGRSPGGDEEESDPFDELFRRSPELRRFFGEMPPMPRGRGFGMPQPIMGFGSGVVIDPSGIILTANHVVEGGGQVVVRLSDGTEFKATDVKTDPRTDLAVVRIQGAEKLQAAKLGNSDELGVGDWVLALGGPFRLEGTVTAGIISAKGRRVGITGREDFLQTDAAINPGNSGGPLVNLDGEVVGINTAISTGNGGNMGVGFAVPVNMARWVADRLVKAGKVERAFLGVAIEPVSTDLAKRFEARAGQGAVVRQVYDDTPAAKAGVQPGDVIVRFGDTPVSSPQELTTLVERSAPGRKVPLEILREGKRVPLEVTLLELPKDFGLASRAGRPRGGPAEGSRFDQLGIEVAPLTKDVAERLGVKAGEGVVITRVDPGSPAEMVRLSPGTVIVGANRNPVRSVDDLKKAIESQPLDKGVLLLVRTAEGSQFVVIRVEK